MRLESTILEFRAYLRVVVITAVMSQKIGGLTNRGQSIRVGNWPQYIIAQGQFEEE